MRPEVRRALADHWRALGELEHSSYLAYEQVARRLDRLDAPAELVERCLVAAHQESMHVARSFELAGRYLGRSMRQGRLRRPLRLPRSRESELAAIAVETLLDDVLLEAYASRMAAARAAQATDPRVRETLLKMASDDAAHAALGRDVVAWCLEVGGPTVRAAVRAAALELPTQGPGVVVPTGLDACTLAAHGLYDADPDGVVFTDLAAAVRDVYLSRT